MQQSVRAVILTMANSIKTSESPDDSYQRKTHMKHGNTMSMQLLIGLFLIQSVIGYGQKIAESNETLGSFQKAALDRGEVMPIDRTGLTGMILPAKSHFKVDSSYVSRHDIVYKSPNFGPYEGFPGPG